MIFVVAFLACVIPSVLFFFWLRSRRKETPGFAVGCRSALLYGILAAGPILLADLLLYLIEIPTGLHARGGVPEALYRTFILFALTEECGKYLMFRLMLRKARLDCSRYDLTVFMTLTGVGFGILESVFYAAQGGVVSSIVSGVTMMHGVFGFITGYFFAKSVSSGKKRVFWLWFPVVVLFHGLYDFSLEDVVTDYFVFNAIALGLVLVSVAVLVVMIVYFARRRADEVHTAPLHVFGPVGETSAVSEDAGGAEDAVPERETDAADADGDAQP